ncbi:hypothetical protein BH11MYX1_BH11MYX1_19990 [soil metagenome]
MPLLRCVRLRVGFLVAIFVGSGACRRGPAVPEGDVLATLTIPSIAGDQLDTQSLTGKPSLVLFVTPTCVHCLATIPHAIEAAHQRDANVVVIFVSGDADRAQRVAQQLKFPGPVLLDDGTLRKEYRIDSVPYTLVLGGDGHATDAFTGEQATSTLARALAAAK